MPLSTPFYTKDCTYYDKKKKLHYGALSIQMESLFQNRKNEVQKMTMKKKMWRCPESNRDQRRSGIMGTSHHRNHNAVFCH